MSASGSRLPPRVLMLVRRVGGGGGPVVSGGAGSVVGGGAGAVVGGGAGREVGGGGAGPRAVEVAVVDDVLVYEPVLGE